MYDTLMLQIEGNAVPTAIQVTETTYKRFAHLQNINLTNPDIPDLIMAHDNDRANDWDNLSDNAQTEFIELWCNDLFKNPLEKV